MSLKRRVVAMERVAGLVEELDGPISVTEWLSGELDLDARRRLGRVGVRDAVFRLRDALARIDWDVPDIDGLGYPTTSQDQRSDASDFLDSIRTS